MRVWRMPWTSEWIIILTFLILSPLLFRINADSIEESNSTPIPSVTNEMKKIASVWECPNITKIGVECSCDFPHTLRCNGDRTALKAINEHLRTNQEDVISLLDITVTGISTLPSKFLEGIALHGVVVSSGELRRVNDNAFTELARPLQALGLPNNLLEAVPTSALLHLRGLERLDLSRNKLKTLEAQSFKGLLSLTYLDLCDNLLSQLSPQAFASLKFLRSLKMQGNRLSVSALSALRGLKHLEELDLSRNLLVGPLGPNLLPTMPRLRVLILSENELDTVKQGALSGLRNLTFLSLSHNQIDVLEDHSFKYLSTLTRLDLSSNRIVAVSSSSLAHLDRLVRLDLTHNFLPSLTADLIVPFKALQDLRLEDNDITVVDPEIITSKLKLKRLLLSDNPLNCDCNILDFANWLSNSSLEEEDKSSVVCATPPALENGILTQVSPGSLLCGEPTPPLMTKLPQPPTQLTLKEFQYDRKSGVNLLWDVSPCTERYTCDNLIIYEGTEDSEVEIDSSPLHCDSHIMRDPCNLPVAIPASQNLQKNHKYRYCIVLLVSTASNDLTLGLGCSDLLLLEETTPVWDGITEKGGFHGILMTPVVPAGIKISSVHVNISNEGFLIVDVSVNNYSVNDMCEVSVVIFSDNSQLYRKTLNCSIGSATVARLVPGRYKVCATLDALDTNVLNKVVDVGNTKCVEVQAFRDSTYMIITAVLIVLFVLFIIILLIGRSILRKLSTPRIQAQCFMPAQEFEITHKAHYIQLLTTTKV